LALEKFAKNTFRKTFQTLNSESSNSTLPNQKATNKIAEEQNKLMELNKELKKKKQETVYLNFCKMILFKKQQSLNQIIEKIKSETGVENLENLSKYLELSSKTNELFETDLKSLNEQKKNLENSIESIKVDIREADCVLNDTSTKKFEFLDKLKSDLQKEEETREKLNKKLFMLNRIMDIISSAFREVCLKLNFFDTNLKFEGEVRKNINFFIKK
jgi:chromosome segregation ATPase